MPRQAVESWDDEDDHEIVSDERDDPQDRDIARFGDDDEEDTVPCPSCGKQVWEMADRCSFCTAWITPEKPKISGRTLVIAGSLVLAMLVALFFLS